MENEISFGYWNRKDYFTIEFEKFDKKSLEDKTGNKFIQLYVKRKPFIFSGDLYHKDILKLSLEKLNLKFNTKLSHEDIIPLEKGENYEMVGAGRIIIIENKLQFYDNSASYIYAFNGTNKKHLEDFFGKENISKTYFGGSTQFLVDISKHNF